MRMGHINQKANLVIEVLKDDWRNIEKRLGTKWHEFEVECHAILVAAPNQLSQADIERVVNELSQLMHRFDYTRSLLRGCQETLSERLFAPVEATLSDQESLDILLNHFDDFRKVAAPSPSEPPSPSQAQLSEESSTDSSTGESDDA